MSTKMTATVALTLALAACGGEPFERDLFTGGAGGASSGGSSGGISGAPSGGQAGSSGAAGQAGAAGAPANPCDACQCNGPDELCPVDPQWHCQGEPNHSCCSCPIGCLLPATGCSYYPTSKMWCCPP